MLEDNKHGDIFINLWLFTLNILVSITFYENAFNVTCTAELWRTERAVDAHGWG